MSKFDLIASFSSIALQPRQVLSEIKRLAGVKDHRSGLKSFYFRSRGFGYKS